jgi:hypothetical protein
MRDFAKNHTTLTVFIILAVVIVLFILSQSFQVLLEPRGSR